MKKYYFLIIYLILVSGLLQAQIESYYYYYAEKREMPISTNYLYLALKNGQTKSLVDPIQILSAIGVQAEVYKSGNEDFLGNLAQKN